MRRMKLACGLFALTVAQLASASDDDIKWNGFMTLAGGMLKDAPVSDTTSKEQVPGRLNYENRFTGMNDSLFALQASKRLNDKLSVTGQIAARGSQEAFKQEITWAYGSYDIDDNSTFRFGRLGLPSFYYSDFIDVGAAYHWITPPSEVYDFQLNYQGLNYLRHDSVSKFDFTTEIFAGAYDQALHRDVGDVNISNRDMLGMSFMATYDSWLTARVMAMSSRVKSASDLDLVAQLEPQVGGIPGIDLNKVAEADDVLLNTVDSTYPYYNASLKADFDKWFVMAEGFRTDGGEVTKNRLRRWYLTSGVRFGNVLTHLTFSKADDQCCEYTPVSELFGLDGINKLVADGFEKNIIEISARKTQAITLGARIDTTRSTAVKVELTKFEEDSSTRSEKMGVGDNMLLRVAFNASF